MKLEDYPYPYIYFKGELIAFGKSEKTSVHYFGGPSDANITGVKHGPHNLHHILRLNFCHLEIESGVFGLELPLFYGIRFDGCELEFNSSSSRDINIISMSPTESCDDWPYEDYPTYLPYIPLKVVHREKMKFEDFDELVMQGAENSEDIITIIVPPNPTCGITMWGHDGDLEEVQIIFSCNIKTGVVNAYNACT